MREIKEGFALLQLCQFLKLRCPGYSVCCMLYLGTGQLQEATRECNCRPLARSHFDLITSATKCVRMLFVPIFNFLSSILISLIFMHQQEIVAKVSNLKFFSLTNYFLYTQQQAGRFVLGERQSRAPSRQQT